jgi:chromosome partitioning protein
MFTIAIVNEKGGTGKTTTAVNLAAALGERGLKVLLVDLDGQAASSRWLGVEDDTRFADAIWRGSKLEPLADVMPGVALAPGHGKLDAVAHDLRPTQGGQLRKLLSEVTGFDYIIIDCPPSLGNRLIGNALLAASHAVVPVETSILALDGLKILLTTLEDVREGFGHHIILAGVLACRFDSRTRLSHLVLEELKRALPGKVFKTVIRENVRMRECPASGKSILAYAPDCHAAADYRALAEELVAVLNTEASGQTGTSSGEPTAAVADSWKEIGQLLSQATGKISAALPGEETPQAAPSPAEAATDGGTEGEQLLRELQQVCQKAGPDSEPTAQADEASVVSIATPALPEGPPGEAPAPVVNAPEPTVVGTPTEAVPMAPENPPAEAPPVVAAEAPPPEDHPLGGVPAPEPEQFGSLDEVLSEPTQAEAVEERFPALEAMLRKKVVGVEPTGANEHQDDKKRPSWLRILERVGGMK